MLQARCLISAEVYPDPSWIVPQPIWGYFEYFRVQKYLLPFAAEFCFILSSAEFCFILSSVDGLCKIPYCKKLFFGMIFNNHFWVNCTHIIFFESNASMCLRVQKEDFCGSDLENMAKLVAMKFHKVQEGCKISTYLGDCPNPPWLIQNVQYHSETTQVGSLGPLKLRILGAFLLETARQRPVKCSLVFRN